MEIAGHKVNNWWLVGGAGALVGIFYFYKKAAGNSATATSAQSQEDPVTGLPYSEDNTDDPMTGMTYLTEAQEYGSVQAAEEEIASGSAFFGQTGTGQVQDAGYPTIYPGYNGNGATTATGGYASNAAWAQAVTSGLVALGYSATDVSAALGLFFAQHPLSPDQAAIVQSAEAEYGPPPQGTYSIIPVPSTSTPPPPAQTSAQQTTIVPNVERMRAGLQALPALQKAGLKASTNPPINPVHEYSVESQTPGAGARVPVGSTVDLHLKQIA